MKLPTILNFTQLSNFEFDYKWDAQTSEMMPTDMYNPKLYDLICKLNHKAVVALVTASAEWVLWQFKNITKTEDVFKVVEALWVGEISKYYLKGFERDSKVNRDPIEGPVWATKKILYFTDYFYRVGKYTIFNHAVSMLTLAHHITPTPHKLVLEKWLANCLPQLIELFPAQYDIDYVVNNKREFRNLPYDSSLEPFIPRAFFFDEQFNYKNYDKESYINSLLTNTNYHNNIYLNTPDEMIKLGFNGKPYLK